MSAIEWTDETWNPVTGCTKVSEGCRHCYAEQLFPRIRTAGAAKAVTPQPRPRGRKDRPFSEVWLHPDRLDRPLHWRKPRRVFVNSMSDLFHEDVPDEFIDRVFAVMALAPEHTFQVLTKRPERMSEYLKFEGDTINRVGCVQNQLDFRCCNPRTLVPRWPLPNVWLGISVENQRAARDRLPYLAATPAAVRFVSAEPLLGAVDWRSLPAAACVDWLIVGGESGPHARPCHVDWIRRTTSSIRAARMDGTRAAIFVKQLGAEVWDRNDRLAGGEDGLVDHWNYPETDDWHLDPNREYQGAPCQILLEDKKGGDPEEWPEDLRVREYPV